MRTNKPPADELLARAAELKANGRNWETVGKELGYSPETVRKWPAKYPARWRKAQHDAERLVAADAATEALVHLRRQVRGEAIDVTRPAHELLWYRLGLERLFLRPRWHRPARPESIDLFTHLDRSTPDDQCHALEEAVATAVS